VHILLIRITKYFFPKSAPFEAEKNNISGLGGREPRAIKNPITAHKHIPLVEHNPINYIFFILQFTSGVGALYKVYKI